MIARLPRCLPTAHEWHVRSVLVLSLAGVDGWYSMLLERQCGRLGASSRLLGSKIADYSGFASWKEPRYDPSF